MKLSFSTRNVDRPSFSALCRLAGDYGMDGFEIWDAVAERKGHADSVLRSEKISEGKSSHCKGKGWSTDSYSYM